MHQTASKIEINYVHTKYYYEHHHGAAPFVPDFSWSGKKNVCPEKTFMYRNGMTKRIRTVAVALANGHFNGTYKTKKKYSIAEISTDLISYSVGGANKFMRID